MAKKTETNTIQYAIVQVGGRQQKVAPGTTLEVNRVAEAVGKDYSVDQVLLARQGDAVAIGKPFLAGAKVVFEVLAHALGKKVITFKYKPRETYRKTVGHRQRLSKLRVKEIQLNGA